ncbi:MAG: hypothetical protein GXP26_11920 [Planctomycetes bacterium]|nr:hypothetical protein [Planctomycetota bacterium]
MGKESPIDQFELSPLAQQKMQELLAVLAEDGFGDGGRPPKETDFATIEESDIRRDVTSHEHSTNVSPNATPNISNNLRVVPLVAH